MRIVVPPALAFVCFAALLWQQGEGLPGGLHLVGAERVLRGDVPYRDFWTLYAPGHYYLLAGLLWLFGSQWMVSSIAGAVCCAIAVALVERFLRALRTPPAAALCGAAVVLAAILSTRYYRSLGTYPPTLLCLAAAWWMAARADFGRGDARRLGWAGAWLGGAALFKHDVAAYSALAIAAGTVVGHVAPRDARAAVRAVGRLALGALAVAAPPYLLLLAFAGGDLVHDLVIFPLTDFRHARPETYPGLFPAALFDLSVPKRTWLFRSCRWAAFALPLVAAVAGGAWAMRRARLRPAAVALAAAFALHYSAAHVQINTHVVSLTLFGVTLAALALSTSSLRTWVWGPVAVGWIAVLAAKPVIEPILHRHWERVPLALPKTRGIEVHPADAKRLGRLRALVEERVPPEAPILVANHRNDAIITNPVQLYFLLDRRPAVRYHELHPAVADTESVQREMVRDLERDPPPVVILREGFDDALLDRFRDGLREDVPEVGATLLDEHLRDHYVEIERLGRYRVLAPTTAPDR